MTIQLSLTGLTYRVTTSLTSPGKGCFVAQHVTRPYTLVKFKKGRALPGDRRVRAGRADRIGSFCIQIACAPTK